MIMKKNKQLCLTQKFHVHAREDFLDEDEIALFLKAGLDINTWGVKNRFRYAYFKEKGVNIVIANKNFKKIKNVIAYVIFSHQTSDNACFLYVFHVRWLCTNEISQ